VGTRETVGASVTPNVRANLRFLNLMWALLPLNTEINSTFREGEIKKGWRRNRKINGLAPTSRFKPNGIALTFAPTSRWLP
jgi:hypothetical protein